MPFDSLSILASRFAPAGVASSKCLTKSSPKMFFADAQHVFSNNTHFDLNIVEKVWRSCAILVV